MQPRQFELQQRLKGFLIRYSPSCARGNIFQRNTHRNHITKKPDTPLNSIPSGGGRTRQCGHGFLCLSRSATLLEESRRDKKGNRHSSLCTAVKDGKPFSQNQALSPRMNTSAMCHGGRSNTADPWRTEKRRSSRLPGSPRATVVLPRPPPRACTVQAFLADPKFPSHVLWRERAQHCSALLAPLGQAPGVSAGD